MKHVAIVSQEVAVDAPLSLVYGVVSGLEHGARPGAGRSLSLMSSDGQRMVVAFTFQHDGQRMHIMKEMVLIPPDLVEFRHLSGPFTGATEALRLRGTERGTDLLLGAEFPATNESGHRLLKMIFEHEAHTYLREIKAAAEARVRPLSLASTPFTVVVPVPVLTTEEELIASAEAQEETEWGHTGHGRGVARVAISLAEVAMLPPRQVDHLQRAALLHDVGKIAVDSAIWGTRGTLTPQQRTMMQAHARFGRDLAERVGLPDAVLSTILHHHERWDGTGYPDRLAGNTIPLRARILFLAEAIDSMLRATYRRAPMTIGQVRSALDGGAGTVWDPTLARTAERILRPRRSHSG